MALTSVVLDLLSNAVQRRWSRLRESCAFTSAELRQAAADTDAWIEANASVYNTALNADFRTKATTLQKSLLFMYVAAKRAGLTVEGENA